MAETPPSAGTPGNEPTRRIERPSEPTRPFGPPGGPARTTAVPHPPPGPRPFPLARVLVGGLLVVGGVLWLLGALDVVDISLRAVLSIALIAVGVGLLMGARTGAHGGLIFLGVILTAMLVLISSFDIHIEGGVGERVERPATVQDLEAEYRLGVGQMTLDLTDLEFPSRTTRIEATVGIGRLVVRLPPRLAVRVTGTAGAGQVTLFGKEANGFDVDRSASRGQFATETGARLDLDVGVGIGQVEVGSEEVER